MSAMEMRDPDRCPKCKKRGGVIDSRNAGRGYRRRRHVCAKCKRRWTSWQTLLNPFLLAKLTGLAGEITKSITR